MPQENIMANARLQTRKKFQGPKIFFCCFNFCSFFLFQKSCNFIYILYFLLFGDGRPFFSTLAWNFCMSRQISTCSDKLRHVGNHTVQCSSVLVLEVVFDGLGQVQFGDFALLNAFFINRLTYNAATQIHQGQRFRVKSA